VFNQCRQEVTTPGDESALADELARVSTPSEARRIAAATLARCDQENALADRQRSKLAPLRVDLATLPCIELPWLHGAVHDLATLQRLAEVFSPEPVSNPSRGASP
jgi:hypothetical protein